MSKATDLQAYRIRVLERLLDVDYLTREEFLPRNPRTGPASKQRTRQLTLLNRVFAELSSERVLRKGRISDSKYVGVYEVGLWRPKIWWCYASVEDIKAQLVEEKENR